MTRRAPVVQAVARKSDGLAFSLTRIDVSTRLTPVTRKVR
jgi:hypothetical protein